MTIQSFRWGRLVKAPESFLFQDQITCAVGTRRCEVVPKEAY